MGEENLIMNRLLQRPGTFADFVNGTAFGGRQVLRPEDLQPVSGISGLLYADKDGMRRVLERTRDICMRASPGNKGQDGIQFSVVACENQSYIDYAMPVRVFLYDALSYTEQVQELSEKHKKNGDALMGDELLSGICKADRIEPVVTIVLYFGKKEWDGSRSLYELMDLREEEMSADLKACLPDYRLNLVHAFHVPDPNVFQTDLQQLFSMLKYNSDKTKLYQYVREHRSQISDMTEETLSAAITLMGEQKRVAALLQKRKTEGGKIDMCQAIDELIEDGRIAGLKDGLKEGRSEGQYTTLIYQIKRKVAKGFSPEETAEMLEKDFPVIKRIYDAINEHPEWNDTTVYENLFRTAE